MYIYVFFTIHNRNFISKPKTLFIEEENSNINDDDDNTREESGTNVTGKGEPGLLQGAVIDETNDFEMFLKCPKSINTHLLFCKY